MIMKKINYIIIVYITGLAGSFFLYEASSSYAQNKLDNSTAANSNITARAADSVIADWDTESTYWEDNYLSRPYYQQGTSYSNYEPAYEYGVNSYNKYNGKPFETLNNSELQSGWNDIRGESTLDWNHARDAMRDSYNRIYNNYTPNTGTNATKENDGSSIKGPANSNSSGNLSGSY